MTFICYPKCTTCQKAQKWLDENGVSYTFRDIKMENPTYKELSAWHQRSGLPLKKFFNTSGLLYKSMGAKGQVAPNERGRDAEAPCSRRDAGQAPVTGGQ